MVIIDDCHGIGILGENFRGSTDYKSVMDKVDMITGSLSKSLGVNNGGYAVGKKELIDFLRQRHRTYLFSNAISSCTAAGAH